MIATKQTLDYYARHNASLFPIPKGQKNPTGIVASWQKDHSADLAQWAAWAAANPDCNFGVYAAGSGWIIMDTDASGDRNEAWAMRCALLTEWGMDPAALPHVQSARGGWHDYFAVPEGVDASQLRQPDAIKKRINIRCQGFTVAAGSYYDGTARNEASGPYLLLSDAPPHPAPAALIQHCTRAPRSNLPAAPTGTRDRGDVAALLNWMVERDCFNSYEDWVAAGMALKLEFGDSGLELWQLTHDTTVDGDTEFVKWSSFSTNADSASVTLASLLDRAHKLGWRGTVRTSTSKMFDGVAQLAAASGASLSGHQPTGMPMLEGQSTLTALTQDVLADFLNQTNDAPTRPANPDYPDLPDALSQHGLYEPLRSCVSRIVAMAESQVWKQSRVTDPLAILGLVHKDTADAVCRRLRSLGRTLSERQIKSRESYWEARVKQELNANAAWTYSPKTGVKEANSPHNFDFFIESLSCELRFNAWLERIEIRGNEWIDWTYVDDVIHNKLSIRAAEIEFQMSDTFLWKVLLERSHKKKVDPALLALSQLAEQWDGTPRLHIWLSATCGVEPDAYHQAVGRNIVGGMVRRIRKAGCKHDEVALFIGAQGTGKSTLAKVLAPDVKWFTDAVKLGDESKELVLSLAGKCIAEVPEMGTRGDVNAVKAMVSRETDSGRTAYARTVTERPRRNIFIASTNDDLPLLDSTGNRRFLPIRVNQKVDLEWLKQHADQLIGEAAFKEAGGETFALPPAVWSAAGEHQEAARAQSDMEVHFGEWFAVTPHTVNAFITAQDLSELIEAGRFRNTNSQRSAIMKALGFRSDFAVIEGKKVRVWLRGPVMRPADVARSCTRFMVRVSDRGRPGVVVRMASP